MRQPRSSEKVPVFQDSGDSSPVACMFYANVRLAMAALASDCDINLHPFLLAIGKMTSAIPRLVIEAESGGRSQNSEEQLVLYAPAHRC